MTQHNLYWTQHEVSFGVWDREKCTGQLRLIPVGCEIDEQRDGDPDAPRYAAYGVYVQVKIEQEGFECSGCDFVHPRRFQELLAVLKGIGNPAPTEADLYGDDGGVEIHFRRQDDGDVLIVGQVPAKINLWEYDVRKDPLLLTKCIKTIVQFEFLLKPERAIQPCEDIEGLLAYLRSLEESHVP
jgi:hypothetical protein